MKTKRKSAFKTILGFERPGASCFGVHLQAAQIEFEEAI